MSNETSSEIAAKLASLLHITQELPSMESSVRKRWEKAYGDTNTNVDGWLEGLFELALQAAEQAIDAICRFEGYKALYVTFARKSLQSLYIPSVQESRVDKCIIEPLNSVLAALITRSQTICGNELLMASSTQRFTYGNALSLMADHYEHSG
jgi:hypothetical protein